MSPTTPIYTLFPYTTLFRSKLHSLEDAHIQLMNRQREAELFATNAPGMARISAPASLKSVQTNNHWLKISIVTAIGGVVDRKSTRLNSSHLGISYAVFCLKK